MNHAKQLPQNDIPPSINVRPPTLPQTQSKAAVMAQPDRGLRGNSSRAVPSQEGYSERPSFQSRETYSTLTLMPSPDKTNSSIDQFSNSSTMLSEGAQQNTIHLMKRPPGNAVVGRSGPFRKRHSTSRNATAEKPVPMWKCIGYRAFSDFLASEQPFFMVRRFGTLNARVALALQDQIVQLENELNDADEVNSEIIDNDNIQNGTFRRDKDIERKKLVEETLLAKLTQYNNFINSYAQLVSRSPPAESDKEQVRKWLSRNPKAIEDEESAFMSKNDDLIAVKPKTTSWLRMLLHWTLVYRLPVFRRKPDEYDSLKVSRGANVVYSNESRLEGFSATIVAVVGLGMLVGPLWILNGVKSAEKELAVITGFIFLFFLLTALGTNSRVSEALAVTAAYSAVLMVFLQLGAVGKTG